MTSNLYPAQTKGSDEKFDPAQATASGFHDVGASPTGESGTAHLSGPDDGFDPAVIKAIRRKIDWRLVPPLSALYAISLIDRTNISLAAQAGMIRELRLIPALGAASDYYSAAVLAFFPPYIAFELFSNIGMRRVGARWWLPTACVLWSIALLGMAFVQNWQGLVALRAILGIFEAALFPGATYLLACWYLRRELAQRLTAFYMVGVFFSGLSALLAYGFSLVETGSIRQWRWIFLGEAIISIAIALPCYWLIVDFPSSRRCTFLTEDEKAIVATRIQRDRADAQFDGLSLKKVGNYALDLKLWVFALCFCFATLGSYALSYFSPLIISSMGFVGRDVYLLVFPPYAAALPWGLTLAFYSDKTGRRLPFISLNALVAALGCCLFTFLPASNTAGRYIGIFLASAAVNSNVPLISSASQAAIRGQSKRSFTSALVVGFGGMGGIISSLVFRSRDAPRYILGMSVVLGAQGLTVIFCILLGLFFMRANSQASKGRKVIEGHPDFRYQI